MDSIKLKFKISGLTPGCSVQAVGFIRPVPTKISALSVNTDDIQQLEINVQHLNVIGSCDGKTFPINYDEHYLENKNGKALEESNSLRRNDHLRRIPHLRPRTSEFSRILQLRSKFASGFRLFLDSNGFWEVHTPSITTSQCETAVSTNFPTESSNAPKPFKCDFKDSSPISSRVECFKKIDQITSDSEFNGPLNRTSNPSIKVHDDIKFTSKKSIPQLYGSKKLQLRASDDSKTNLFSTRNFENSMSSMKRSGSNGALQVLLENSLINKAQHYLTVSAQMHLEAAVCGSLGRAYTFGPVWRGESHDTCRHLAEFYMLEVEACFISDVQSLMDLCEEMIASALQPLIPNFRPDEKVRALLFGLKHCKRISYTEAAKICGIQWGSDLKGHHERVITDLYGPTFVHSYPFDIKPFYMRSENISDCFEIENNSGSQRLVAQCFDLLLPGFMGEGAGGSLREDRIDRLEFNMTSRKIDTDLYRWYLDINRWGAVPHGGFGIGFDRLLAFVLGHDNIRDVVLFPRDLSSKVLA